MEEEILKSLNPKQKEAVLYNSGSLAIIAGAGTGKTKTITHKIAYLIQNMNILPYKILAVTFTNKAAKEMKQRVINLIGEQGKQVQIYTYHSFCAKILREDIEASQFKKNFNIIDTIDQKQILKVAYKKMGLSYRDISYSSVINAISKFKNNKTTLSQLKNEATEDVDKVYANLYEFYLNQTFLSNSLDFDDLLIFVEHIFKNNPILAEKWASRFEYVMVDEFQDTSIIQYNIIKELSKKSICIVVGDPDQNIYTWRYADPRLILNFNKNKKRKIILLEQNYRSTQTILNSANKLIKNNKERIDKNLFTINSLGQPIQYYQGFSDEAEARWVISEIQQLINQEEKLKDIAILYRANFLSQTLEKELIKNNINYSIYGSIKFYQREEIKDIVAYLKLINNGNTLSLKRVINVPSRNIGAITQDKIYNYLDKFGNNTFDLILERSDELNINAKPKKELLQFINLIQKHQIAIKNTSIKDVIEKFLIEINYKNKWSSFEERGRLENIEELIRSIESWEKDNPQKKLNDYLNEISLYIDDFQDVLKKTYISLMTIHTSKGLEFKHVFIFGMSEPIFPSIRSLNENQFNGMEEERRLAYVAVTRAKEHLYISSSRGFSLDRSTPKEPSRFIKELGIDPKKHSKRFIFDKYSNTNIQNNDLIEGDEINHNEFGNGVILSVEDIIIRVAFKSPHGVKTMMKNHSSIEKGK